MPFWEVMHSWKIVPPRFDNLGYNLPAFALRGNVAGIVYQGKVPHDTMRVGENSAKKGKQVFSRLPGSIIDPHIYVPRVIYLTRFTLSPLGICQRHRSDLKCATARDTLAAISPHNLGKSSSLKEAS